MAEISPLRRRMIEDMTVRNLSPATQQSYLHAVSKFSRHFGHSPDRLGLEEVHAFQLHLVATGVSWPSLKAFPATLFAMQMKANRERSRIAISWRSFRIF